MGNRPSNVFILNKYSIIFKQASLEFFTLFDTDLLPRAADIILAALRAIKELEQCNKFVVILVVESMMCFSVIITDLLHCVLCLLCFHFLDSTSNLFAQLGKL